MIHVCSLARLHATVETTGAGHVVTLLKDTDRVERPPTILAANHLILGMDDISAPLDGYVMPGDEHVRRLIDFVRGWDRRLPMVVHCYAGISRSTGAPMSGPAGSIRGATRRRSRTSCAAPRPPPRPMPASCRSPTACSGATAAWSRRSTRSAAARWPTRACRSGSTWIRLGPASPAEGAPRHAFLRWCNASGGSDFVIPIP